MSMIAEFLDQEMGMFSRIERQENLPSDTPEQQLSRVKRNTAVLDEFSKVGERIVKTLTQIVQIERQSYSLDDVVTEQPPPLIVMD